LWHSGTFPLKTKVEGTTLFSGQEEIIRLRPSSVNHRESSNYSKRIDTERRPEIRRSEFKAASSRRTPNALHDKRVNSCFFAAFLIVIPRFTQDDNLLVAAVPRCDW
jgi:hypothetical protein